MIGAILLLVAFVIVAACAGISALRGFSKSALRTAAVLVSALAAIITCLILKAELSELVLNLVQENSDQVSDALKELNGVSPLLVELIPQLIGALIAPIVCLVFFFLYWTVFSIACLVLSLVFKKLMHKWNKKIPLSRLWAAGIGFVEGLVIVGMLFIPISGYLSLVRPAMDGLVEQNLLETDETTEQIQTVIRDIDDAPVLVIHRTLGGELVSDGLMKVEVGGNKVNLRKEVKPVMGLVVTVSELGGTELSEYGIREADLIRSLGTSFKESKLLAPIVGDVLFAATDAWLNGETFLDMEKPSMGEDDQLFGPFLDRLFLVLHDDAKDAELLQADIQTLADVIAIFVQNDVIANLDNEEKLVETLGGDGVVKTMIETLGKNESMKVLIPEVTNLGVRAIGQVLNIPANADEVYGEFMDEVAAAINSTASMTEEQRVETLTQQLTTAFDEAGVAIDPEILDFYSASMLRDLVDNNDKAVTAEDVKAFFNIYAENSADNGPSAAAGRPAMDMLSNADALKGTVYEGMTQAQLKNTATAVLAGFCVDLSRMNANDADFSEKAGQMIRASFGDVLGASSLTILQSKELTKPVSMDSIRNTVGMQSPETMRMVSTVVTLDILLIDADAAADRLNAEGIQAEAVAIEAIFNTAGTLLSKMNQGGSLDLMDMAASVGSILDTLKATGSFGADKTASLFTSIMQSETVRDAAGLDMNTATIMAQKGSAGNGSYTQTMTTVADSVSLADKLNKDEEISDAELEEMIRNLTPQTAGMLEIYMTAARMEQFGVPAKYSAIASAMTQSGFSYMGREDLADYNKEAQGLNQALDMFMAAKKNNGKKNLFSSASGVNDGILPTSNEFVERLMGSDAICYAMTNVLTDGSKVTTYNPFGFAENLENKPAEQEALRAAILNHKRNHPEKSALAYEALAGMFNISLKG